MFTTEGFPCSRCDTAVSAIRCKRLLSASRPNSLRSDSGLDGGNLLTSHNAGLASITDATGDFFCLYTGIFHGQESGSTPPVQDRNSVVS